jgi:PPOX class probable F420-dependent enzyme
MSVIPEKFLDLLQPETKAYAFLATLMPDGSPQVTPVWFDYVNGRIRINTLRGRVKDRNMSRDARVALTIMDLGQPFRHLSVRGRIAAETEAGAREHIDVLARKYLGQDYAWLRPGDVRVIYEIEPLSAATDG